MSEEQSFEDLLNNQDFNTIRNGSVVEGTVIDVKPDVAYINIGYKADGVLTKEEYSNDSKDLTAVLNIGDKLEVKVLKANDGDGQVVLSYKRLAAERGSKRLEEAFNNKEAFRPALYLMSMREISISIRIRKSNSLFLSSIRAEEGSSAIVVRFLLPARQKLRESSLKESSPATSLTALLRMSQISVHS